MICARCGRLYEDDLFFVTCSFCRVPDRPRKPRKGCRMPNVPRKEGNERWLESGSSFDNIVRAYEEER